MSTDDRKEITSLKQILHEINMDSREDDSNLEMGSRWYFLCSIHIQTLHQWGVASSSMLMLFGRSSAPTIVCLANKLAKARNVCFGPMYLLNGCGLVVPIFLVCLRSCLQMTTLGFRFGPVPLHHLFHSSQHFLSVGIYGERGIIKYCEMSNASLMPVWDLYIFTLFFGQVTYMMESFSVFRGLRRC